MNSLFLSLFYLYFSLKIWLEWFIRINIILSFQKFGLIKHLKKLVNEPNNLWNYLNFILFLFNFIKKYIFYINFVLLFYVFIKLLFFFPFKLFNLIEIIFKFSINLNTFIYFFFLFILIITFFWNIKGNYFRRVLLLFFFFLLINLINLWFITNKFFFNFQFSKNVFYLVLLGLNFFIGLDGISLLFLILTVFLTIFCLLGSWYLKYKMREFLIILCLLEILLFKAFIVFDLYFFFIIFETILIPMFFIIGLWGSRGRKVDAAYKFFLYTLLGSVFLLFFLIIIWFHLGLLTLELYFDASLSISRQFFLWILVILGLSVKVPMYPVHIWLPEAHVEAPTFGSVLLAGILLKLGTYAIYRFILPLFIVALCFFLPFIMSFCLLGIILGGFLALFQIDLKKLVAFSSISHMNFVMLGLLSSNFQGIEGSLITMLSHGLVSGALFFLVGVLYERYGTRIIWYYGGLVLIMPFFCIYFFLSILGNFSFPGTISFIGELLISVGLFWDTSIILIISFIGLFLVTVFSLIFFGKVSYGLLKSSFIVAFSDLVLREQFIFFFLVFIIYIFGIIPDFLIKIMFQSIFFLLSIFI